MPSRMTKKEVEAEVLKQALRFGQLQNEFLAIDRIISRKVTAMEKTGAPMADLNAYATKLLKEKQKLHDRVLSAHSALWRVAERYAKKA